LFFQRFAIRRRVARANYFAHCCIATKLCAAHEIVKSEARLAGDLDPFARRGLWFDCRIRDPGFEEELSADVELATNLKEDFRSNALAPCLKSLKLAITNVEGRGQGGSLDPELNPAKTDPGAYDLIYGAEFFHFLLLFRTWRSPNWRRFQGTVARP
jgi:hypothetical protein